MWHTNLLYIIRKIFLKHFCLFLLQQNPYRNGGEIANYKLRFFIYMSTEMGDDCFIASPFAKQVWSVTQ